MKYFAYKEDGLFNGFYTEEIHGENIPERNIKINEELWKELLKDNYKVKLEALSNYSNEEISIENKDLYFEKVILEVPQIPQEPSQNDLVMLAIAELDAQREQDKLETQLAIAELTNALLGGE